MAILSVDAKAKLRSFWEKYWKTILVVAIVVIILIIVNHYIGKDRNVDTLQTTYAPTVSVLNDSESVPKKVSSSFEDFIGDYVDYLNNGDYVSAYNLVSDDCKTYFFNNSYNEFVDYVSDKFDSKKIYSIQSYSEYDDKYIYSVKFYDDYLATGLTNQSYRYVEEMMAVYYDDNGDIQINVGNYMDTKELEYQTSNDYLKIEVIQSMEKYSFIIYNVKLTNRSNYTVVLKDGNTDEAEIYMDIGDETRECTDDENIILDPGETQIISLTFPKYFDSGYDAQAIVFNAVRVMENYTGEEEKAEEEIENAIYKASMTISME